MPLVGPVNSNICQPSTNVLHTCIIQFDATMYVQNVHQLVESWNGKKKNKKKARIKQITVKQGLKVSCKQEISVAYKRVQQLICYVSDGHKRRLLHYMQWQTGGEIKLFACRKMLSFTAQNSWGKRRSQPICILYFAMF